MRLNKISLKKLAENSMANREMKEIKGGDYACACSCMYYDQGGSSNWDNSKANALSYINSPGGCNCYYTVVITPP